MAAADGQDSLGSLNACLAGKHVLITGATGFIGKVLTAKILLDHPAVAKLHLLIRSKPDASANERLITEVIQSPVFWPLRQQLGEQYLPFMSSKLQAVDGDTSMQPCMGLGAELYTALQQQVQVVFNLAAQCKFRQPVDDAVMVNALGAQAVGEFVAGCTAQQVVLVHVSTAYVHGTGARGVEELPLSWGQRPADSPGPPFDPDALVSRMLQAGKRVRAEGGRSTPRETRRRLEAVGQAIAEEAGYTNVYVLSKALGEMLATRAVEQSPHVLLAIVRPSIVESCLKPPFRGWNQGVGTTAPMIWLYAHHRVLSWVMDPCVVLDIVPCDVVVNTLLAAMWAMCTGAAACTHAAAGGTACGVVHATDSISSMPCAAATDSSTVDCEGVVADGRAHGGEAGCVSRVAGHATAAAGYANGDGGCANGDAACANGDARCANGDTGYANGHTSYTNGVTACAHDSCAAGFANGGAGCASGDVGCASGNSGCANGHASAASGDAGQSSSTPSPRRSTSNGVAGSMLGCGDSEAAHSPVASPSNLATAAMGKHSGRHGHCSWASSRTADGANMPAGCTDSLCSLSQPAGAAQGEECGASLLSPLFSHRLAVYHVASSTINPCALQMLIDTSYSCYKAHPARSPQGRQRTVQCPGRPCCRLSPFLLRLWLRLKLPGLLLGVLSWVLRPLPWLPRLLGSGAAALHMGHRRLKDINMQYAPYTTSTVSFCCDRLQHLRRQLQQAGVHSLDLDVSTIDWPTYLQEVHIPGLRCHVFKDCESQIYAAKLDTLEAMVSPCTV